MVCAADAVSPSSSGHSNSDLEIGCLIDLATGFVSFTANGAELPTAYQVKEESRVSQSDTQGHMLRHKRAYDQTFSSCGKYNMFRQFDSVAVDQIHMSVVQFLFPALLSSSIKTSKL